MAFNRIVNASPVIYLEELGLLDLLNEPGVTVFVPDVVVGELGRLNPNDPAMVAVRSTPWIQMAVSPAVPAAVQAWKLDAGESAVLALAVAETGPDKEVVLDDRRARLCAASLGIRVQGTLSLLLIAKSTGRIAAVKPLLEQLRQRGMYLSDRLCRLVLKAAGE